MSDDAGVDNFVLSPYCPEEVTLPYHFPQVKQLAFGHLASNWHRATLQYLFNTLVA